MRGMPDRAHTSIILLILTGVGCRTLSCRRNTHELHTSLKCMQCQHPALLLVTETLTACTATGFWTYFNPVAVKPDSQDSILVAVCRSDMALGTLQVGRWSQRRWWLFPVQFPCRTVCEWKTINKIRWSLIPEAVVTDTRGDGHWYQRWWSLIPEVVVTDTRGDGHWYQRWWSLIPEVMVTDTRGDGHWYQRWWSLIPEVVVVTDTRGDGHWYQRWWSLIPEAVVVTDTRGGDGHWYQRWLIPTFTVCRMALETIDKMACRQTLKWSGRCSVHSPVLLFTPLF